MNTPAGTAVSDRIQNVIQSAVWYYWGRRFSFPGLNYIHVEAGDPMAYGELAADVFRAMVLPIEELQAIFQGQRLQDWEGDEYDDLGACPIFSDTGWSCLAVLTKKTIRLIHHHGDFDGQTVGIYDPSGNIQRLKNV